MVCMYHNLFNQVKEIKIWFNNLIQTNQIAPNICHYTQYCDKLLGTYTFGQICDYFLSLNQAGAFPVDYD